MRNLRNWHYCWCVVLFFIFLQYDFFSSVYAHSLICVSYRTYEIDYCSLFLSFDFRISSAERSLWASILHVSKVFMHTLLGDMLMCLIYVINDFHCLRYLHIDNWKCSKIFQSNLSAKRSSLKPCNFKSSPMTPDFLYNFLTLLQSRYQN
jgi:hypothetical protein